MRFKSLLFFLLILSTTQLCFAQKKFYNPVPTGTEPGEIIKKFPIHRNRIEPMCRSEIKDFCPLEIIFKSRLSCLFKNINVVSQKCENELDLFRDRILTNIRNYSTACEKEMRKDCPNLDIPNLTLEKFEACMDKYTPKNRSIICRKLYRVFYESSN